MLSLYKNKLTAFHWAIVCSLALLLMVSFNFVPAPEELVVDIIRIIFGTAVFTVVIILKQLDELSLFGKTLAEDSANDIVSIIEQSEAQNHTHEHDYQQ